MSEIRRKLVIVGDGACGKVCLFFIQSCRHLRETGAEDFSSNIDLFVDCFLERNFSRGEYHQPLLILLLWLAGNYPGVQTLH
jgi:hypothetical protein